MGRVGTLNCLGIFFPNLGEQIIETALGSFSCKIMVSLYFKLRLEIVCKAGDFRYFKFDNRE